jgi:site-specific DNA-methyltransferase (adenine-specific)
MYRILKDDGSIYVWCGIGEKSQSLIRWFPLFSKYFYFKDLITWKKQRGLGMKKGWLYTREELMWFVKDNKNFIWVKEKQYSEEKRNYIRAGGKSYYKRLTNIWTDINEEMYEKIHKDRINKYNLNSKYPTLHKTIKPVKAIKRIIESHTKIGDIVLDCCAGSFTTAEACINTDRRYICIEKEKEFYLEGKERIKNLIKK